MNRLTDERWFPTHPASRIIVILLMALIVYSIVIRVQLYMLGVSLWYDEGLLIDNIIPRSMSELISTPLTLGWGAQSAPIFYLVVVKAFTLLFGVSETSVRILSFIFCIGLLVCLTFLLKKAYRLNAVFIWFGVALVATFPYYIRYSHEMKPYIGDAFFALLIILLYVLYREKRINLILCTIVYAVILEFSTPSLFFIGSVLIVEFLRNLRAKDRRTAIHILVAGIVVLLAFALNYYFWLRSTATDPWMNSFWTNWRFRLPFSFDAIRHDLGFVTEFLMPFGKFKYMVIAFGAIGFVLSLIKRNIYSFIVGLSFILLLAASILGKYPVISRLWLFFYVFVLIYAVVFISSIWIKMSSQKISKWATPIVCVIFSALLLFGNASFPSYANGATDNDYPGMNINPLISYVKEKIDEDEYLYSFESATPVLKFKNGFDSYRIGNTSSENIIYGTLDTLGTDVPKIIEAGEVYLLYYRGFLPFSGDIRLQDQLDVLVQYGYVDKVLDINYTPLYRYTSSLENVTTKAEIELLNSGEDGSYKIIIRNTGATILESGIIGPKQSVHLLPGAVQVVEQIFRDGQMIEEHVVGNLSSHILIGESQEVDIQLLNIENADLVQITLVSEGRYDFAEIGLQPLVISG